MKIIILGPPGAGKGTQAEIISKKYGIPHLSVGEIFRENIRRRTELGLKVQKYVESGELVPDEIVIKLTIRKLMESCGTFGGYVLDGYPRTLKQAEVLDKSEVAPEIILSIKVSEDECVRRLSNRRYCTKCGATYNLIFKPPKKDEICDLCGAKLIQREDDKEEVIRNRFREYYLKTKPVLQYYRRTGKLFEINGEGTIDEVTHRMMEVLKSIITQNL
ncbi:MAG: adenylate kinase [archaeon GB-1867-097]|nr:adenylate kinase [Candidatus Culexmicrobium thermophilum]MCS7384358.1 adenylate kinase [Candidatus Culexmicrobium thermophilum]HDO21120.1 adenylate kinase [Candidatus Bathyarchaeota archaeon]